MRRYPVAHLEQPGDRRYPQIVWRQGGKVHRLSAGTADKGEVQRLLLIVNGCLAKGEPVTLPRRNRPGPGMDWEQFRELYRTRTPAPRPKSLRAQEGRLDWVERLLNPKSLADITTHAAQLKIRSALLSAYPSRHSAKSRFASIRAAIRWGQSHNLCGPPAPVPPISTSKIKAMRGRPLTPEEFSRYLDAVPGVVGEEGAESWTLLIRGIEAQGWRVEESLMIHWSDPRFIVPDFTPEFPVLRIPASMQKNDTEEAVPMTAEFASLARANLKTEGWLFNPALIRREGVVRDPEWVSKVLGRIGVKAGIITGPRIRTYHRGRGKNRKAVTHPQCAGAHDLRRTCAQRLMNTPGLTRDVVKLVMRHADIETTIRWYTEVEVQKAAAALWANRTQPNGSQANQESS